MPDGTTAKLEILGEGQEFVAFGIHPDTMQPFAWPKVSPLDVPLAELPTITALEARDLIGDAEAILRAAGGTVIKKKATGAEQPELPREHDQPEHGGFFRAVNTAALSNIPAWVTALHPGFRDRGNSGWRLASKDLGRNLEEDISVHPDGVRDFGTEEPLTAIDLVLRLGEPAGFVEAPLWLCERLGIRPACLGWRGPQLNDANGRSEQQRSGHDEEGTHTPLSLTRAADLAGKRVPVRRWLIDGWIPMRRVTGLYGPGGEGKTTLLQMLMTAAATGDPWLGHAVKAAVSMGLFCEDDDEDLHIRQDKINAHYRPADGYTALSDVHWDPRLGKDNLLMTFTSRGKGELTKLWYETPRTAA